MKKISACIICQDEEYYIERALKNIYKYVNEIVVVDGGSQDKTLEICKKYNCKIFERPFDYHFADQRNFGQQQCKYDWVLWLDADEYFNEKFLIDLQKIIHKNPSHCDGYHINIYTYFDNKFACQTNRGCLLRRLDTYWVNRTHEHICSSNNKKFIMLQEDYKILHKKSLQRQQYNNLLYDHISKRLERPDYDYGAYFDNTKGRLIKIKNRRDG